MQFMNVIALLIWIKSNKAYSHSRQINDRHRAKLTVAIQFGALNNKISFDLSTRAVV